MTRRIALIVALGALLIAPGTASAATKTAHVEDNRFVSGSPSIELGDSVQWQWDGTINPHSVTADKFDMFDSGVQTGTPTFGPVAFGRAGGFTYHCTVHSGMRGTVMVKMSPSDSTPNVGQVIVITFATGPAPFGFSEQIQKRKVGGTWRDFSIGNTGTSVNWTPLRARTFQFRARLVQGAVISNWSPTLSLTVTAP